MNRIVLKGEPKSTNNIYKIACTGRFPRNYMSDGGKTLKQDYQYQAKIQWKEKPLTGPLDINIKLHFKTRRKHDIDNYGKILLDSLTGIVWEDDVQIQTMRVSKWIDQENPRIEIEIEKLLEELK